MCAGGVQICLGLGSGIMHHQTTSLNRQDQTVDTECEFAFSSRLKEPASSCGVIVLLPDAGNLNSGSTNFLDSISYAIQSLGHEAFGTVYFPESYL